MTEQQMRAQMAAVVSIATQNLTNQELVTLNNVVHFPGYDATTLPFYDKVSHLFQGGRMHSETKIALGRVVERRLGGE